MHLLQHAGPPLRSRVFGDDGEHALVSHKLDLASRDCRLEIPVQLGVLRLLQVVVKVANFVGQGDAELDKRPGGDGRLLHVCRL